MRKILLMSIVLLCCYGSLLSQTGKITVAIFPFVCTNPQNHIRSSQIQQFVVEILRKKSSIELIDRSSDSLAIMELDMQIREHSVGAKGIVQQGKMLGAQHMIVGTVSNVSVQESTKTTINVITRKPVITTQYTASISFALQLKDVETGNVISHKVFDNNDLQLTDLFDPLGGIASGDPKEKAITAAMKAVRKKILLWINDNYPPEIKILQIENRDRRGNAETVLVSGIDDAIQRGTQITVNIVEEFETGGKKLRRVSPIGTLKVKDIQGDITVCRVTSGDKALEQKMTEGARLQFEIK